MSIGRSAVSLDSPAPAASATSCQPVIAPAAGRAGQSPRHQAVVRITHWIMAASVLGLFVSGGGILISHPRLYWGETGAVGAASLFDLPVPFVIGPSVWNRPYHFFAAWIFVLSAFAYVIAGCVTQHFRKDLLPARADLGWRPIARVISDHLRWKRTSADEAWTYNVVQRLTYLGVVFVLFPGILWTGLAMSFGVSSVFPMLATALGGHQSARTLHFVFVSLLVIFFVVHIAMLFLVGFWSHVRAMITGYIPQRRGAQ
jgi:thiosulfate reductase cytochrome b subunit